jgi:hypothetical protein
MEIKHRAEHKVLVSPDFMGQVKARPRSVYTVKI